MAGYVCCEALGFVLLFLLSPAFGQVQNLKNIIDRLQSSYGFSGQYALGINVPAKYCDQGANLDQTFLSQDGATEVKSHMSGAERIYVGLQLVGARPKIGQTGINIHSEYLLLMNSNPSPMQNLLNILKDGCTVFYTYNSPCVNTCSKPNGRYSILPALNMFNNHNGPKAFVFTQIWHYDVGKDQWEQNILQIENHIPVYLCNNQRCVRCVQNNAVNSLCKG